MKPLYIALFCIGCSGGSGCTNKYLPRVSYANPTPFREAVITKSVCIENWFDEEDRRDIEVSIAEWTRSLNGAGHFPIGQYFCDWKIIHVDKNDAFASMRKDALAYAQVGGDTIRIIRSRIHSQEVLRGAVLHEIGHLLTLDHPKSGDHGQGLMSEYMSVRDYQCVDGRTLDELGRRYNLTYEHLNPCLKEGE